MFDSLHAYEGQAAGLLTSVLWTATSLLFTAAAKRIGPTVVNASRIVLAVALLAATHRLVAGTWWPEMVPRQVVWLALSGIVGLSIGDQALFTAFVYIGPRVAMLVMTTSPLIAALFGWVALGESLHGWAWAGVMLTIGGVGWVVMERPSERLAKRSRYWGRGLLLAFVGAACQAGGLWLSKEGMGHGWLPEDRRLTPQAATFARMTFAALGMVPIVALHYRREAKRRASGLAAPPAGQWRAGLLFSTGGAVVGPFLGVWMSLVACDRAPLGIAQTLCSLSPIFLLPFAAAIHKERISYRAVFGAALAVAGSALLFVRPG